LESELGFPMVTDTMHHPRLLLMLTRRPLMQRQDMAIRGFPVITIPLVPDITGELATGRIRRFAVAFGLARVITADVTIVATGGVNGGAAQWIVE